MDLRGVFPFGTPAGRAEPRSVAAPAPAFVLGVYPSALHIRWAKPKPPHRGIAALAVAPEPWPFWDGRDEEELVVAWKASVGWNEDWGDARPAGRVNGSSGQVVRDRVLHPLGLTLDQVWLTDVLPFFHVHQGKGKQGDAMQQRYDTFARTAGLEPHRLPDRPSPAQLVQQALAEEADRLRGELLQARAPLLVTLGNEALAVAAALCELPAARLQPGPKYGLRKPAQLADHAFELLPLVHPGQRSETWRRAHERWMTTPSL